MGYSVSVGKDDMAENTIQTVLKILETVIAPSVGELKAHAVTTDKNFELVNERMQAQFKALMGEMQIVRAQIEASTMRQYTELRERVAVLESQMRPKQ